MAGGPVGFPSSLPRGRTRTLPDGTSITRPPRNVREPNYTSGYADNLPKVKKNADGSYTISLRYQDNWKKSDFRKKAEYLQGLGKNGQLVKTPVGGTRKKHRTEGWRSTRERQAFGEATSQSDANRRQREIDNTQIDHAHDLQLGGKDERANMWEIHSETNHGLGGQINEQIKDLPDGAIVRVRII